MNTSVKFAYTGSASVQLTTPLTVFVDGKDVPMRNFTRGTTYETRNYETVVAIANKKAWTIVSRDEVAEEAKSVTVPAQLNDEEVDD